MRETSKKDEKILGKKDHSMDSCRASSLCSIRTDVTVADLRESVTITDRLHRAIVHQARCVP